jgi:hypothetical protein
MQEEVVRANPQLSLDQYRGIQPGEWARLLGVRNQVYTFAVHSQLFPMGIETSNYRVMRNLLRSNEIGVLTGAESARMIREAESRPSDRELNDVYDAYERSLRGRPRQTPRRSSPSESVPSFVSPSDAQLNKLMDDVDGEIRSRYGRKKPPGPDMGETTGVAPVMPQPRGLKRSVANISIAASLGNESYPPRGKPRVARKYAGKRRATPAWMNFFDEESMFLQTQLDAKARPKKRARISPSVPNAEPADPGGYDDSGPSDDALNDMMDRVEGVDDSGPSDDALNDMMDRVEGSTARLQSVHELYKEKQD